MENTKNILSFAREVSRNPVIRSMTPPVVQKFLWNRVVYPKARSLQGALLAHIENTCLRGGVFDMQPIVSYLKTNENAFFDKEFYQLFLEDGVLNLAGAKLPDITNDRNMMYSFCQIFTDVFIFPVFLGNDHDAGLVRHFDPVMMEGPYGYTDGDFDVRVKAGDVVIDAGAWIGDFSAYAASIIGDTGKCFAFEPIESNIKHLEQTSRLNGGRIVPVCAGLGDVEQNVEIFSGSEHTSGGAMYFSKSKKKAMMHITTIDDFIKANALPKLDFIKSDIEGAERDLLNGATHTLKTLKPKLAICTYHSSEDPALLEGIIKKANPDYRIEHTAHKLFAMVLE